MSASVRTPAGLKSVANIRVRTVDGLKSIQRAFIRTPDGLKQFFGIFGVSVAPTEVGSGINSSMSSLATTREAAVVTVEGAIGTPTFLWSQVSGDAGWTIISPTAASTKFAINVGPGETMNGVFKCAVSDAGGHSADTAEVMVSAFNRYGGVGGTL